MRKRKEPISQIKLNITLVTSPKKAKNNIYPITLIYIVLDCRVTLFMILATVILFLSFLLLMLLHISNLEIRLQFLQYKPQPNKY